MAFRMFIKPVFLTKPRKIAVTKVDSSLVISGVIESINEQESPPA